MDSANDSAAWPEERAFAPLPYEEWRETKLTLHLWMQIVGKVRLALAYAENHWWHVPFYVTSNGLSTSAIPFRGANVTLEFDFVSHLLRIATSTGAVRELAFVDGMSVAHFYRRVSAMLRDLEIDAPIRPFPYGGVAEVAFPEDEEHRSYDPVAVARYFRALVAISGVFMRFRGMFAGKSTPLHYFWHSFDLALTRFSGRRAPPREYANDVERFAYSHEVVSFGFWPGDDNFRQAAFYSYTSPEAPGIRDASLEPEGAFWTLLNNAPYAIYPYDRAAASAVPSEAILTFLHGAYAAGAPRLGWDVDELARDAMRGSQPPSIVRSSSS